MPSRLALALCAAAAVSAFAISRGYAQDDWEVKQNPFSKEIVNKWKRLLEKDPSDAAALKKLLDLYTRYSKVDKLIQEYEAELSKKPDSFAFQVILGHLHRNRGQIEKALAYYDAAARIQPDDPTVQIARAELYRQQRKVAEAIAAYEEALPRAKTTKDKKAILRALADLSLDERNIEKARKYFQDYIDLDPSDVTARIELADALSKHKLHAEALDAYKDALAKLGTDPQRKVEVLARVGNEYEELGKPDDAVKTYRQAIDLTQKGHYLRKQLTERIIDIHRKRQDLRSLIAQNEKAWPAGSRGHFEWDVMARLYEEAGEQEKALEAFRKAVKIAPYELDTQRRLIALLERLRRDDEALAQYEQVIRVAPGEPRFQLELAERYHERKQQKKALDMAKEIARRFPDDPGVHAALADLYTKWREEALALKEYEILVKIEPHDDQHLVNLGDQWFQRQDHNKAMEIWKKIAAPKTPESYARLAEVLAEHDKLSDAVDWYNKAIALKPKDPALYRGLAGVQERLKADDRAIDSWNTVLRLTDGDATQKPLRREARSRIISIWHKKPGNQLATRMREWQRQFHASKPPSVEDGYFAAEAAIKLGRYEDAEKVLNDLLKHNPKDGDAKHQLVQVFKNQHKYPEAIAMLKTLAEENPGRERDYYTQISELELLQYHDDEAIRYALQALEKSPNDPQAQERLAEIYAKRGTDEDYAKAVEAYRRAIELDPRNFKVHAALAKLYLGRNKTAEAAALYREIIKKANDEDAIRKAAQRAIDLEEYLGTLGDLEKEVAPLAFVFSHKSTYRKILVEIYDRYVDPLVARARRGDAEAKKELVRLGEHGLKPLLEALTDQNDATQQRIAVRVLGHLGNKNAAPPLVKLALEVPEAQPVGTPHPGGILIVDTNAAIDMEVRVEALVSAGRLGDPRTIPSLIQLTKHREVALREAATWALGQARDKKALEPLVAALGDSRASVQAMACLGLGALGDRRGLDRAAEAMKDTSRGVDARAACAYALGLAANPAYVPALSDVVADGNDEVQVKAAWALGRIGDPRARPALLAAYFARKDGVRGAVVWALARIPSGSPDTSPMSGADDVTLLNGKIDYRTLIRNLIGELDGTVSPSVVRGHAKEIVAGIEVALGRHRDVIARVLRDLDARDDGLALGRLTATLDAAPAAERDEVNKILTQIGDSIAPRLAVLCGHRDPDVRALALDVLAKLGGAAAAERLDAALGDDVASVRLAALVSVERFARRATPAQLKALSGTIVKRLQAGAWQERAAAVVALGRLGPGAHDAVAAPLTSALGDSSGFVREAAARSLGALKRADSVPHLIDATRDETAEVRLAAVQSLVAIGGDKAGARLAELAREDPDPRVRAAAQR